MDSKAGSQSTEQLHYKSSGSDNRLPLIFSILAVLIAVIAVIIAAVGLSRSGQSSVVINGFGNGGSAAGSSGGNDLTVNNDERIWLMQVVHNNDNAEYLDEATGQIKGFNIDIVNAVCRIAGKNCELVEDIATNCLDGTFNQNIVGGTGLMAGYYDACTAWEQSYSNRRIFKFSDPFGVASDYVGFGIKEGNPSGFSHTDITGKIIGLGDGWSYDVGCLEKDPTVQGTLALEDIRHFVTTDEMIAALRDGSVDAVFGEKGWFEGAEGLTVIDEHATTCDLAGRSMMMRKDNPMWKWWNPAFKKLLNSREYRDICNDLLIAHGDYPGYSTDICIKT